VVLELEWVLRGAYRLERQAVITALEELMGIRQVHVEQEELVRQALEVHRGGMDVAWRALSTAESGCGCRRGERHRPGAAAAG
jgi:predicted nucleic-acid-binding protein